MFPDIFSSFDPSMATNSFLINPQNLWMINLMTIIPLMPPIWLNPSHLSWSTLLTLKTMHTQLSQSKSQDFKGWTSLILSLFMLLILLNLIGLTPFIFSLTSHLLFTSSFSVTLWLSLILSSFTSSPSALAANLLPSGAPTWLNPFLVLIESTSTLVRPMTLAFRLAANMTAGHVIIILSSTFLSNILFSSIITAIFLLPIQASYTMFEVGICIIQAYIFCLLLSLYANEHP